MLVIRLQRTGRENLPTYRVVVAEKARPVKGKFLEIIGHYLPQRGTESLTVQQERVTFWVGRGAVPSNTVARLLKRNGLAGMEKFIVRYTKRKPKNPEETPAEAAPAAAAPVAEVSAPATEETPPAPAASAEGDNASPAA